MEPSVQTVQITLAGDPAALIKIILFLTQVFKGDNPGDVLRVLHLAGIDITGESGHARHATLTLGLREAPSRRAGVRF